MTTATLLRDSPQPPPSPSPAAKKDGPTLLTNRSPSTPSTPSDIFRPGPLLLPPSVEIDNNTTPTNTEQTTQVSIRDRMAAAEERGETTSTNRMSSRNPLDKYTDHEMEEIHYNHPMALLKNIDLDTIGSWEEIRSGKLLAQPFGAYASNVEHHSAIKSLIFAAAVEITNAVNISVCAPRRSPTADKNPISFLIHNLSEKQRQTLLARGTWSSTSITFRVAPLEPACPNYLFSIKGWTTQSTATVYEAIRGTWDDASTEAFLTRILNQVPEKDREQAKLVLHTFTSSLSVTMLDTRNRGNALAPTFQVYAAGGTINEDRTWCQLRAYLASRDYIIPFEDPGINNVPSAECSLCHGGDHPRGLCPSPMTPGWNGPTRKNDPPLIDPATGRKFGGTEQMPNSLRDRNGGRANRS
jgi:hypothetical protein